MFYLGYLLPLIAAATQTEALYTGTLPMNVPTFEVTMSGVEPFFAGMQLNGTWVMDHGDDLSPTQQIDFIPDIPYASLQPIRALKRNVSIKYEMPAMRRERLQKFWNENGYTFIEAPKGWIPVKQQDIALAERARTMASGTVAAYRYETPSAQNLPLAKGDSVSPTSLHAIRAAVILAGLIVMGIAAAIVLRRKQEWTPLE